jgi:PII-like signaling protein
MKLNEKAKRLRIYISSTDKYEHSPLYEVIVYSARKQGLTGATVLKGIMGYGASSQIYTSKLWEITDKVPLVVEIIDEPEKVDSFFENIKPLFDKLGKGHLITADETSVLMHNPGNKK